MFTMLNESGGPVNFKATTFRKDYCQRLIQMAETKSAFIALLISRHIQFVHGKDAAAKNFCKQLLQKEKVWMEIAGVDSGEVNSSYQLVEFCDAFSLLLCQGLIQPEHRRIEISTGPEGEVYEMHALRENEITVTPWPFDKDFFEATFESRIIDQLKFKTLKQFRNTLNDAKVHTHRIKITSSK
jgi:hypothetical protein